MSSLFQASKVPLPNNEYDKQTPYILCLSFDVFLEFLSQHFCDDLKCKVFYVKFDLHLFLFGLNIFLNHFCSFVPKNNPPILFVYLIVS